MSSFDGPRIVQQINQQSQVVSQGLHSQQTLTPETLVRTTEPVWAEDEEREQREGAVPVPLASPLEQDEILAHVNLGLPDRLIFHRAVDDRSATLNRRPDYVLMDVPVSFSADSGLIPKRLKLTLNLSLVAPDTEGMDVPVAVWMHPKPVIDSKTTNVAAIGVDVAKLLGIFAPVLADAFTLSANGQVDRTVIDPRIQATGLQRKECEWIISDRAIAYDFRPSLIAQAPGSVKIRVQASAHVEVQRNFLHLYHKAYGISKTYREYIYEADAFSTAQASDPFVHGLTGILSRGVETETKESTDPLSAFQSTELGAMPIADIERFFKDREI
jgi:hypothetical protein